MKTSLKKAALVVALPLALSGCFGESSPPEGTLLEIYQAVSNDAMLGVRPKDKWPQYQSVTAEKCNEFPGKENHFTCLVFTVQKNGRKGLDVMSLVKTSSGWTTTRPMAGEQEKILRYAGEKGLLKIAP